MQLFDEFDQLRAERLGRAQEFIAGCGSLENVTADVSNVMMLAYAAIKATRLPQGFRSGTG